MLLQDLPPELLRQIYSRCSSHDLVNLSCCSSLYYDSVKPVLWNTFETTWDFLQDKDLTSPEHEKSLHNLVFVKELRICGGFDGNSDPKIAANYKVLVEHCNPKNVQVLDMLGYLCDEDGECARLTCSVFKNLIHIHIRDDYLPPSLYTSVSALTSVTLLDLYFSKTTDADMLHICHMKQLKYLNISSSRVSDIGLSQISNLKELITLKMGYNYKISGVGLAHLDGLVNLTELDASSCCKVNCFPSLTKLSSLKNLQITGCSIKDIDFINTDIVLKNIEQLNLQYTPVTDQSLQYIGNMHSLIILSLSGTCVTDAGMPQLTKLTALRELYLSYTTFTDAGLLILKDLNLHILGVSNTQISDNGLEHMSTMKSLQCLLCSATEISDAGIASIGRLSNLERLSVEIFDGGVTSDGLMEHLSSLKQLRYLDCLRAYEDIEEFYNFCRTRKIVLNTLCLDNRPYSGPEIFP